MQFHMSSFMQNFPHEELILVREPSIFITKLAFSYLAHLRGHPGLTHPGNTAISLAPLILFLHQPPGTFYKPEAELQV